ncbi:formylglycine-generating enzyme family protein [Streptococcus merionis]|uniref:formylglycine-generating enzyme family protein n=1 Tax=Streptococcus merionis TaxID=400065 RepID=UPI0026EA4825|nr:formylglycine-generating enzyme family protein [Streptococcus merionis]
MPKIPSGKYFIGTNGEVGFSSDTEGPITEISLSAFEIDATTVTNQEFQKFVNNTGYQTEAERFGWSFVFHYFLDEALKFKSPSVPNLRWWHAVEGADWRHPEGPNSKITDRMDYPVVHVSRNDALAYCRWARKRLPTEAEWEVAAKGGTENVKFPWGDIGTVPGPEYCNVWQGDFPFENDLSDGFAGTAPAKHYDSNGYGCYQMIGNIWEWCLNPAQIPLADFKNNDSDYYWENHQSIDDNAYAIKGGSFLCHPSYCKRYRIAARNKNTGMSSANNMGFRCVTR